MGRKKEEVGKVKKESSVALKYFSNLVRESGESKRSVTGVDLEGPMGQGMPATGAQLSLPSMPGPATI